MILFIISILIAAFVPKDDPALNLSDLKNINGEWVGYLMYKDYSNNKEVVIPAQLLVTHSDTSQYTWLFAISYPDEPHMNNSSSISMSIDGNKFDNEFLISKNYLTDSSLHFITESTGEDNEKKATLRHIYTFSNIEIVIRKEVKYDGENEYFFRNEYKVKREI